MKFFLLFLFLQLLISNVLGQEKLPVIKSNKAVISIRDGEEYRADTWILAPEANPDIYQANLIDGKPHYVTFYTDLDSIQFFVELGKNYDFNIQHGSDICYTRITGVRFMPAAVFDETYRSEHKGKFFIEIPEVYELVNVAIAITPFGVNNKNWVFQKSAYYKSVRERFDPYRDHPLIRQLDSVLTRNENYYATLKMNGYSFIYDSNDNIIQSPVYDRTGFGGERNNSLRPYLKQMQSFSDLSDFRSFYKQNRDFYNSQIKFYRDTANVLEMKKWLDKNFPGSNDYDTYKIIFSPLVAYNQSSTWFESNGFKELQPHVNFPYRIDFKNLYSELSEETVNIYRGNIVFTEINHGYINPEADRYFEQIQKAVSHRDYWVDSKRDPLYYPGNAAFNEYMNWGLVNLRIMDYVPEHQQSLLTQYVVKMMVKNRGFIRFAEFNSFLMELYKNRKVNQSLADLYPKIISWFDQENNQNN